MKPRKMLKLDIDKKFKVRQGLYMDEALLNTVHEVAENSGISWNQAAIELIERGLAGLAGR